jgi:hypothetical protein
LSPEHTYQKYGWYSERSMTKELFMLGLLSSLVFLFLLVNLCILGYQLHNGTEYERTRKRLIVGTIVCVVLELLGILI